ncbi:MAG: sulfite exporter TauE/SafE family protein [bacterium]|nr:sulfite exporter TauE/SafE family protein [bacterium]
MKDNIIKVKVSGLHCKACEMLSEDKLTSLPGVKSAKVSHLKQEAEINFGQTKPDKQAVGLALRAIGYDLADENDDDNDDDKHSHGNGGTHGKHEKGDGDDKNKKWKDLGLAALIAAGLFGVLQIFGWGNIQNNLSPENLSLGGVSLIGLIAGVSTCMALVGGIVMALAADYARRHPEASTLRKFTPHLFFNLGRIVGFFILGGLLGLVGSVLKISPAFSAWLTLAIGFLIAFLGLQILDIFPAFGRFSLTLPKSIGRYFNKGKKNGGPYAAFTAGAVSFFLPCGFTQSMQIFALSSGSFISGGLIMSVFALGTAPGLLGLGGLVALIKGKRQGLFFKTAGLIIILFGILNFTNGYNFLKLQASAAPQTETGAVSKGEVQIIEMEQHGRGYRPANLVVEVNRPVRWVITSTSPYSCASDLVVPALKINQRLVKGENIIEFTPTSLGKIGFSCSMGMYSGVIEVVDKEGSLSQSTTQTTAAPTSDKLPVCNVDGCK